MAEPRRCRRCKRKRLDDEPPEVQQYKTCAKCRIIERTKKKLRKPLAEETMRYGLKQFHEQNQNANFIHEEIFYSEQLRKELEAFEKAHGSSAGASSTSTSGVSESSHPQPQQQRFSLYQGPADITSIANAAVNAASVGPAIGDSYAARAQAPRAQPGPKYPSQYPAVSAAAQAAQAQAAQAHAAAQAPKAPADDLRKYRPDLPVGPLNCELCTTRLDPKDSIHYTYRLCHKCYEDPFNNDNVFGSYNEYLLYIANNAGKKDLSNLIFICEMDSLFADSLESSKPIITELQFRQFVLDSLKSIYLDPIIASIRVKYNNISNNVNEINVNLNTVNNSNYTHRLELFKQTHPVKFYYKSVPDSQHSDPESTIYLNYNLINNLLIIKINYKLNQSVTYPEPFLVVVKNIVEADNDYKFDDDVSAIKVYNHLVANPDKLEPSDQKFLQGLSKEQFVKDFLSLPDRVKPHTIDDLQKQIETQIAEQIASEEPVASTAVEPAEAEQPVDPVFEP